MRWAKSAGAVLAIGALAGCGVDSFVFPPRDGVCVDSTGAPCPGMRSEADRSVVLSETMPDTTYIYVISRLSMPEASDADGPDGPGRPRAAGFDLDGLDSGDGSVAMDATCEQFNQDFVSMTDPDHRGVDNAFQGLVRVIEDLLDPADCPDMNPIGCFDAVLQQRIAEGSLLLLIEVSAVNDFTYDSSVRLQIHVGALAEDRALTIGADGRLSPGQAFVSTMAFPAVEGDIFEGRVAARGGLFPLSVDVGDFALTLMATEAQLRFDISDTDLTRGAIGGAVTYEAPVVVDEPPGSPPDPVSSVVESFADLHPSADPQVCQALSIGLLFEATTATLN